MRAFLISQADLPIAVVFHHYASGDVYCRSVVRSFSLAFDAVCSKHQVSFKKEGVSGEILRAVSSGAYEYDWARSVLDQLCVEPWKYKDLGAIAGTESSIDAVISQYLT